MTSSAPEVLVVMATYNGDKYLLEQLESIERQVGVKVSVLAIDDGSTDSTLGILEEYKQKGLVSKILHTDRVGSTPAFIFGTRQLSWSGWVSFSDQDDLWDSMKLINAINAAQFDEAVLVSGNRTHINNDNEVIGRSIKLRRNPHWKNALVENICYGNTILINQKGMDLVKKFNQSDPVVFDAWLYLIFALKGKIIYLEDSGTRYRLHDSNTVGIGRTWKFNSLKSNQRELIENALSISRIDEADLNLDFLITIGRFEKYLNRNVMQNLLGPIRLKFYRQRILDTILLRLLSPWVYRRSNQ